MDIYINGMDYLKTQMDVADVITVNTHERNAKQEFTTDMNVILYCFVCSFDCFTMYNCCGSCSSSSVWNKCEFILSCVDNIIIINIETSTSD